MSKYQQPASINGLMVYFQVRMFCLMKQLIARRDKPGHSLLNEFEGYIEEKYVEIERQASTLARLKEQLEENKYTL